MKLIINKIQTLSLISIMIAGISIFVVQNYEITLVPIEASAAEQDCIDEYTSEENCTDDYDYQCDY